ncbi:quinone oxidoreductase family protein [Pseudonocardia abyssalis]|uniref:Zinc-binding dehydrogenase n=1 Tax=Pseudonocardia abyssalis TaxID=2792008 RepID=A0ABS6ULF9_9PSEU|nr:zinc-binding dehydrogenase [Pseudonocardia abyssalis]MBW0115897.1 zinc-binding dehydrogenase [Pseudonocardia abyssalis]MBW0133062.1 zinc-binding dehydrogenase [Pseudonocardia abyssalis]
MIAAQIRAPGQAPEVAELPDPAGEALVAVQAAPITPLDLLCASGTSYFGAPATPYVPGVQGVGTLAGPLGDLAAGTPVWFATTAGMAPGDGSLAQRAAVTAADVVALPPGVDPVLAAALGLSAVAAWMCLTRRGRLAPGETVIVLGAGGVVGQAAVQLARLAGAGRVVACARSASALDLARSRGADATVLLDARDDLAARLAEASGGADLVIDPLSGAPAAAALSTLRPGGRLVNLGGSAADSSPVDSATLRSCSLDVLGYTNASLDTDTRRDAVQAVCRFAAERRLTVGYERVPLTDATDAWTRQRDGTARGRIVLVP